MKKNTATVLFSKIGVVLFFLMFLVWNQGQAQSYVSSAVAQTRLSTQAETWSVQYKANPSSNVQLGIKTTIFEKMILHLQQGATVAQAIEAGTSKYVVLCKDKDPGGNIESLAVSFRAYAEGLLSN